MIEVDEQQVALLDTLKRLGMLNDARFFHNIVGHTFVYYLGQSDE